MQVEHLPDGKVKVSVPCCYCDRFEIFTIENKSKVELLDLGVRNFKDLTVQQAFPEVNANQREILVSGMCSVCFDEMFKEEE